MSKRIIVAIDGPAGAGKSTLARRIAEKLGCIYIDTGAMYRAVALWALRNGTALEDMHRLEQLAREADIEFTAGASTVLLNGEDVTEAIRTPEVSDAASRVSAIPGVRQALVRKQREIGATASVVMEGRDIGTIVFPEADVKVFLDAEPAVRADRRVRQLATAGRALAEQAVASQIDERDRRDRTRAESPLVQAPDAVYLDSSGMDADEVEQKLLRIIRERTSNGKERRS
ncbi:MAG TPA: (d)CMP kinase [Bryobacteraceae bacterium]|nr:(d)CMP kinase [Bryobacteraceae bacterium]